MNTFKKFFGHLHTINKHKVLVFRHCFRAGICFQGIKHDLSKYSLTEFVPGVKYYTGTHSPNEGERKDLGYSLAWIHHKGRNKHHFEYWNDINIVTKKYESVAMPYNYVVEMFCDRVAASKVYRKDLYRDDDALNYFMQGSGRKKMHEQTREELQTLLEMLAHEGEKKTFAYAKRELKKYKKRRRKNNER